MGLWVKTINEDLEKVNAMFGLQLRAKYAFEEKEVNDAEIDTERPGAV